MSSACLILIFLAYSVGIFWISSFWVLGSLLILELGIVFLLLRGQWRDAGRFLLKNCGFVIFIILCNLLFADLHQALLIGFRLGLAIEATYIVSRLLSLQEFARGIAILCTPLQILHVDTEELALSITVALTFIPILMRTARQLRSSLKLKGCNWRTLCRRPQVYIVGLVAELFRDVEQVEQALRLKGYE